MEDLKDYINKLRYDFSKGSLDEKEVDASPFIQFERWFKQAVEAKVIEPNAMMLATCGSDGKPSARVLLLRNFNENGFVFYTNYHSRKGVQSQENGFAAMSFFWPELERQVRIEGGLVKQSPEESDAYFASRPRQSKIGAWVSPQSHVIANRKQLDDKFEQMEKEFGEEVPRPPHWGGFVLQPVSIEFWQGRSGRLHDRILYTKEEKGWRIERLAP
jgi:pyridoxamine 5'-phosphate oxidase